MIYLFIACIILLKNFESLVVVDETEKMKVEY